MPLLPIQAGSLRFSSLGPSSSLHFTPAISPSRKSSSSSKSKYFSLVASAPERPAGVCPPPVIAPLSRRHPELASGAGGGPPRRPPAAVVKLLRSLPSNRACHGAWADATGDKPAKAAAKSSAIPTDAPARRTDDVISASISSIRSARFHSAGRERRARSPLPP